MVHCGLYILWTIVVFASAPWIHNMVLHTMYVSVRHVALAHSIRISDVVLLMR